MYVSLIGCNNLITLPTNVPPAASALKEEEEVQEEALRQRLKGKEQAQASECQSQEVQGREQVQSYRHGLQQR